MPDRKMVVVLPDLEDFLIEKIRGAAAGHGFSVSFFTSDRESLDALKDAEVLLGQSPLLVQNAPRLKWINTPSAGVEHLLQPGLFASPDAILTNSSGAYGVTISEHVIMVTLEILRRQQEYTEIIHSRQWIRNLPIRSLRDARITLLGTGDIGQETALRLRAFGPASLVGINRGGNNPGGLFDRVETREALPRVLPETDLLICSLPGVPDTRGMLSAAMLALLPEGAVVVNVGRGALIDQFALETELRAGRLWAALDVFAQEPLPPDDSLWTCPHLLITPHSSGNMTLPYTRKRIVELFLENLDRYCAGEPLLRRIDPEKGY